MGHFISHTMTTCIQAVHSYEDTVPRARQFNLRLIEMTALSIHEMAAHVSLRANNGINKFPPPPQPPVPDGIIIPPHPPTDLFHQGYGRHTKYPHGVASMVGYWAEWAIFGGVVLFHRGKSGKEVRRTQPPPPRQDVTDPSVSATTSSSTPSVTIVFSSSRRRRYATLCAF